MDGLVLCSHMAAGALRGAICLFLVYRLLKEKKKKCFTALYGSRRLVIRKEFEKYLDENPEEREALKNGSRKIFPLPFFYIRQTI